MRHKIVNFSVFVVMLSIMLGFAGCEWSKDASVRNPSAPGDVELMSNFSAVSATGDTFGIALGSGAFRVTTLPGDYVLTYTTMFGTFYIPYRAVETAKLTIGLQPSDAVLDVTLQPGTLTDISSGTALDGGTVVALSWPGSGPAIDWEGLFTADLNLPLVVLVRNGRVVESDDVEDLTGGLLQTFGVYIGGDTLQLYVPKGDYLVEYTTESGTFHVVVRAILPRFFKIFLLHGDTVLNVSIQPGTIPYGMEPVDAQGAVEFYFLPDSSPTLVLSDVFIVNVNFVTIILVQGGQIITTNPFVTIIVMPGLNLLPWWILPVPGDFGANCGNLIIPAGALPPPGECKVWDPYLPAGQQGPPGGCSCTQAQALPGACLIDHFGNSIACY